MSDNRDSPQIGGGDSLSGMEPELSGARKVRTVTIRLPDDLMSEIEDCINKMTKAQTEEMFLGLTRYNRH